MNNFKFSKAENGLLKGTTFCKSVNYYIEATVLFRSLLPLRN